MCGAICFASYSVYFFFFCNTHLTDRIPPTNSTPVDNTKPNQKKQKKNMFHSISFVLTVIAAVVAAIPAPTSPSPPPPPLPRNKWPIWPSKFHARLVQNRSGALANVDHFYDFKGGASLLMIRSQLNTQGTLIDYEFANGSTYYYQLGQQGQGQGGATPSSSSSSSSNNNTESSPLEGSCTCIAMGVGLLRPTFLRDAGTLLGPALRDGLKTLAWHAGDAVPPAKGPFMTYYALESNLSTPVSWTFYTGARFDVMSWNVPGAQAPNDVLQLPASCLAAKCQPPPSPFTSSASSSSMHSHFQSGIRQP